MTVKLQVNVERMVENLRYAFSNQTTVLAELLQNGRRAGATRLVVEYDDQRKALAVSDDGCGISDFQKLLVVADSGWNEEVQLEDGPYGLGFLSAVYSAERVSIASNGQRLEFRTQDALGFAELQPYADADAPSRGTTVTLFGIELNEDQVRVAVHKFAAGFSIPVVFSSVLSGRVQVPQLHRLDDTFKSCDIGHVRVGRNGRIVAYLQGICVYQAGYVIHCQNPGSDPDATVVHLNKTFKGRMPDRDTLVDAADAYRRITQVCSQAWRDHLQALKTQMTSRAFAESYWEQAKSWGVFDVMNDVPWLPWRAVGTLVEMPRALYPWERDACAQDDSFAGVSREDVESGEITLCHNLPTYCDHGESDSWWAAAAFAFQRDWRVLVDVPNEHWAKQHAQDLNDLQVDVVYQPLANVHFNGDQCFCEVVLCEDYELVVGESRVRVRDQPLLTPTNVYLVPNEAEGHEGLRQICDFIFDERYDEAAHDREDALMRRCIASTRASLRGGDQVETLRGVLTDGNYMTMAALQGCSFVVKFNGHMELEVQQVPTNLAAPATVAATV